MNDLITQIGYELQYGRDETPSSLLRRCRSELQDNYSQIARLLAANEKLAALNIEYFEQLEVLKGKGEPVAYRHWCECDMDEAGNPVYDWEYFDKASCPECVPLYTAPPPSVDSITNEIIGNLYEMVMELTEPNNSSEELKAKYRASVVNLFEVNDELQKR